MPRVERKAGMAILVLFLRPVVKEINPAPLLKLRLVILRFTSPTVGHCVGLSVKISVGRVVMLILPPPRFRPDY